MDPLEEQLRTEKKAEEAAASLESKKSELANDKMCPYTEPKGISHDQPKGRPTRKRCPVCGRRIVTDPGPGFPAHKKKGWYKKGKT